VKAESDRHCFLYCFHISYLAHIHRMCWIIKTHCCCLRLRARSCVLGLLVRFTYYRRILSMYSDKFYITVVCSYTVCSYADSYVSRAELYIVYIVALILTSCCILF